ncbi:MAG: hypothetical protein ACRDF8_04245, partial [Chloroflexota bacterium]
MRTPTRLAGGLLAGALLLGTAGSVIAAPAAAKAHPSFAVGQVSNLSSTGFTLSHVNKKTSATVSVTVALIATSKEHAIKGTTGSLANGEYALVTGSRSSAGLTGRQVYFSTAKIKAKRIRAARIRTLQRQVAVLRARHHVVAGAVTTGTQGTTLAILTKNGKTRDFTLTTTTKYFVQGK